MDAQTGKGFLTLLLNQRLMGKDDLEEAIKIASEKSPTGAFRSAGIYFVGKHGTGIYNGYLAFQKGTRWLAMIRRDEGQAAFDAAVAELRQSAGGTP